MDSRALTAAYTETWPSEGVEERGLSYRYKFHVPVDRLESEINFHNKSAFALTSEAKFKVVL